MQVDNSFVKSCPNMPEQASKRSPEQMAERSPEQLAEQLAERSPEQMAEQMPEQAPNLLAGDFSNQSPSHFPNQLPNQNLEHCLGQNSKQWVVVRLSALGDVVLTTGVLEHWHKTKGWRFIILTRQGLGDIFKGHPAVDEVVNLHSHELDFPVNLGTFAKLARKYSGLGLIDLHDTLRTRLLAALWRGRVVRYNKLSVQRRFFLLSGNKCFEQDLLACNVPQRYALAVDNEVSPASKLIPRIFLSQQEKEEAKNLLQEKQLANNVPLVALHPYATHTQKAWPYEHWHQLLQELKAQGLSWIIIGRDEATQFKRLGEVAGGCDFTNQTNLRQTCALLSHASMLITADSGPMHLACAVNTPVLALFGPTTRHWGFFPSGANDRVLEAQTLGRPYSLHGQSKNKGQNCMKTISCATVLAEVKSMLKL